MKKIHLIFILSIFISINLIGEDIHFSQFNNTPLLINPGLTGMGNGYSRANLNYRSQWTTTGNPFSTAALSVDLPIYAKNMDWKHGYLAAGLTFFNDKAGGGIINTNSANLAISSILFTGKNAKIALGILGGYMQKSIKPSNIQWDSQYDGFQYNPALPSQENFVSASDGNMDLSAGISYKYAINQVGMSTNGQGNDLLFEIGAAAFHLLEPKFNFLLYANAQVSRRYVGHARFLKSTSSPFVIGGSLLYMQQAASQEFTAGVEARYTFKGNTKYTGYLKGAYLGFQLLYRNKDAIIPVISYKFNNWKISTSYDYNISALRTTTNSVGGFEISIQFNDFEGQLFGQGDKYVNYRGSTGDF